jgi:hypothetical protein
MHGEMKHAYRVLVSTAEGKEPFGRSCHKAENNVKNGLVKIV